jgi:guanylate kinase
MSKKRIVLTGCAASGKDHARKILEENSYTYGILYTTRPPRVGEVDGKDYFFSSVEDFQYMESQGFWHNFITFNGWFYGTTKEQFYGGSKVFIMTPKGLDHLSKKDRDESLVIYFNVDEKTRRERMQLRQGNADSVERRLKADFQDFQNFKNFDIEITDKNFTQEFLLKLVNKYINHTSYV